MHLSIPDTNFSRTIFKSLLIRQTFLRRVYRGAAGDLVAAFLKESPSSSQEREALRRLLDEMEV